MISPDTDMIIERFGQWAITLYGIECVENGYAISWKDLAAGTSGGRSWAEHLAEKSWVDIEAFQRAQFLAAAFVKSR